ncbi:MAG: 6-phosphofructokinase [Firmicutes bacterium]|nr:6-phosphofructokinase [Bacillota bacterium]
MVMRIALLTGGGDSSAINAAIRAVVRRALAAGHEVIGIKRGWRGLIYDEVEPLFMGSVSGIIQRGGTILGTSRTNPFKVENGLENIMVNLRKHGIEAIIAIGGDDTNGVAHRLAEYGVKCVGIPQTIDNDLPLPGGAPTFGFNTARHLGFQLLQNIMEDSRSMNRWYFVAVMGRSAGHLALGIGKAAGATLVLIPEEFGPRVSLEAVCDVLEGAMLKRRVMGRQDGVAVIAEGILERVPEEELARLEGVRIVRDPYGHIRLAELDLAYILKSMVEARFARRGDPVTIVHKSLGYELRCAPPVASDSEYVRDLGFGAVEFLLGDHPGSGALICRDGDQLRFVDFRELLDPETGRPRTRLVDIHSTSYRVARKYMIRLEPQDFEDPEQLRRLAEAAKTTPEEFRRRYRHAAELPATTGT